MLFILNLKSNTFGKSLVAADAEHVHVKSKGDVDALTVEQAAALHDNMVATADKLQPGQDPHKELWDLLKANAEEFDVEAKKEPTKPKRDSKSAAKRESSSKPKQKASGLGRPSPFDPEKKIMVLNKENPYREGTSRFKRHVCILESKTVAQAMEAFSKKKLGALPKPLRRAIAAKLVKLA